MADRVPTVPYVAGRRGALARALAREAARLQGVANWHALPEAERERLVDEANLVVATWVGEGVLVEFLQEFRER